MAAAVERDDVGEQWRRRRPARIRRAARPPTRQQHVRADVALEVDRQVVAPAAPPGARRASRRGGCPRSAARKPGASTISTRVDLGNQAGDRRVPAARRPDRSSPSGACARTAESPPATSTDRRCARAGAADASERPGAVAGSRRDRQQADGQARHRPGRRPSARAARRYRGGRTSPAPGVARAANLHAVHHNTEVAIVGRAQRPLAGFQVAVRSRTVTAPSGRGGARPRRESRTA